MTQGTMPGADHIFTFTLKDDKRFDVSYRLWAREKGNKSMFEVVFTAGAILTAAELPTKIEFVNTNWTGGGTPPFVKGVPVTGAAIYEHDATQKAVVSTTLNENELVYYGYVSAENLNLDFARAPFQVGDDIEIGVQTVIDTATMPYLQKDIAVNPSDIKWFKSFKRR